LLIAVWYHDLVIARYESDKAYVQRSRSRR
jgi:hypothetical protein